MTSGRGVLNCLDMDDLLTPVKTVRNVKSNIEKFETLSLRDSQIKSDGSSTKKAISEVANGNDSASATLKKPEERRQLVVEKEKGHAAKVKTLKGPSQSSRSDWHDPSSQERVSSQEQAAAILKEHLTEEKLEGVLHYLENGIHGRHDFNLHVPSAPAAQILNLLATNIIPDRWGIVNAANASPAEKKIRESLLSCMSSIAGVGVMVARIRSLLASPQLRQPASSSHAVLRETISFFNSVVRRKTFVRDLLDLALSSGNKSGQQQALWAEATSLLAGSKILNVLLEASAISELRNDIPSWLQDSKDYTRWLGVNIATAAISLAPPLEEAWKMLANLLKRALSLGYKDVLVVEIYMQLLLGEKALWTPLRRLTSYLPRLSQKMMLEIMLQDMSKKHLSTIWDSKNDSKLVVNGKQAVGGVASVIAGFIGDNEYLEAQLVEWLTGTSGSYTGHIVETRRAMILVLSAKEEKLHALLEKSMKVFSDKLHIKHDSVLQQEALAQVILLTAGYLHRMKSQYMIELSKSSSYLQAVSNRLAASLPQVRFLGMVVGMAISRLTDPTDKIMKFDVEDMDGQEAEWWSKLSTVEDTMGSIDVLEKLSPKEPSTDFQLIPRKRRSPQTASPKPKPLATSKIVSIEEVDDSESEDDLIPYQKPDEDPEDSDDDPTLINRAKPKAPVYIHDLIKSLNVIDKPEVVELALKTAPSLIRRKANFGTEVSENITSLASSLINLQDALSTPDLQDLRLQSLIACLISQPSRMGPWFSNLYFTGDFSLSQRGTLLTVLGLSSRELAGHKDEGSPSATHTPLPPSQTLPPHLASLYSSTSNPITQLSTQIASSTLRPTASPLPGPPILTLRPFSSRPAVQARASARALDRSRRIPKDLHKLLAQDIYLPLCCRMSILLSSAGGASGVVVGAGGPGGWSPAVLEAGLLRLFLQTLTVLLTTIGPYALQLPLLVRETVLLLTAVRRAPRALALDPAVLPSALTLLLVLLDVVVERGGVVEEALVDEREVGAVVVELVGWVAGLVDGEVRVPEQAGEGMPWRAVAAGVQVRWWEIARKFQGRLMGMVGVEF